MDYISDFHEPFTLLPTWRIVRNCFLFYQPQVKTLHFRYYIIGSAVPDLDVVQLIFIIAVQRQPTLTHWGFFWPIFVSDVFQTNVNKMAELREHVESVSVRPITASYYNNNQIQILLNFDPDPRPCNDFSCLFIFLGLYSCKYISLPLSCQVLSTELWTGLVHH